MLLSPPTRSKTPVLDHSQNFSWASIIRIGISSKKKRAAVGAFEPPATHLRGSRTFASCPKSSESRSGLARAAQFNAVTNGPCQPVDKYRNRAAALFLAGPAFPDEQDRAINRSHAGKLP